MVAAANQTRLEAELRKLAQDTEVAKQRSVIAQQVAVALHGQRMNDPIHVITHPPMQPIPASATVQTVDPDTVQAAVAKAMKEEKRSLAVLCLAIASCMT